MSDAISPPPTAPAETPCAICGKIYGDHFDGPFCDKDHGHEEDEPRQFRPFTAPEVGTPGPRETCVTRADGECVSETACMHSVEPDEIDGTYVGTNWRTSLFRNVTVSLELAESDLDADTPDAVRALALLREALGECRRLLKVPASAVEQERDNAVAAWWRAGKKMAEKSAAASPELTALLDDYAGKHYLAAYIDGIDSTSQYHELGGPSDEEVVAARTAIEEKFATQERDVAYFKEIAGRRIGQCNELSATVSRLEGELKAAKADALAADALATLANESAQAWRVQFNEAEARVASAERTFRRRHVRLSEAVGIDPNYSADATVDGAIKQLTDLRASLARVEGERNEATSLARARGADVADLADRLAEVEGGREEWARTAAHAERHVASLVERLDGATATIEDLKRNRDGWVAEHDRQSARVAALTKATKQWDGVRSAIDLLREQLDKSVRCDNDPAPPLRMALIGQQSDATFYSEWERNKLALVDVLNALDAALGSSGASPCQHLRIIRQDDGRTTVCYFCKQVNPTATPASLIEAVTPGGGASQ